MEVRKKKKKQSYTLKHECDQGDQIHSEATQYT